MDRFIHTALNAMGNLRGVNSVNAQNLANMNVPGFRRDFIAEGASFTLEDADGNLSARAFQLDREEAGFSDLPGFMDKTGEDLDIAIPDKGYFYIQPETGGAPALTRRGDLRVGLDGALDPRERLRGTDDDVIDRRVALSLGLIAQALNAQDRQHLNDHLSRGDHLGSDPWWLDPVDG